jgi:hypothetical protein
MEQYVWLIPFGFVLGACGTLIGAGGGFILVPALLLLYPDESPEVITSISLAVVFFNALSGSWAYARMGRIDYKSGLLFATAAIPGAIVGALSTAWMPRHLFDTLFGLLMVAASVFLFLHPGRTQEAAGRGRNNHVVKTLVEKNGVVHNFSYNPKVGVGLSFFVGYISSALGIGGGIVHVPVLVRVLNFPVHVATATSHFILAIMALTGTLVHVATGSFSHGVNRTLALGVGALLGAQVGAMLSGRVKGSWIVRGLAIALGLVGVRLLTLVL